jgi:PAS domain S-box-containing protein
MQGARDSRHALSLALIPATRSERRLALSVVGISAIAFAAAAPFATRPLAPVPAFIPIYQTALIVNDLVTALLLFGQFKFLRLRSLLVVACGYLFTGSIAIAHLLSFPGLFSPTGLLGAGPQTTAWLYMFWHAGFPACVIAYAFLKRAEKPAESAGAGIGVGLAAALAAVAAFTALATAGHQALPPIMNGNGYTATLIFVVASVWGCSLIALLSLLWRRPHTMLDLWLMVVMCAWLFDIALAAVLNAGRFDVGFYAGRIYGLLAASFVLVVLLVQNGALHARLAVAHAQNQRALERHADRLKILAAIDRALLSGEPADAIAASVIQALRVLLDVPRAIVNRFDLAAGQVEWIAAAGRRRTHVGPGVRYPIALMGDVEALGRGEPQLIDVSTLPRSAETEALLASGVRWYMAVPMIAGGELVGALSFGGETPSFRPEQINTAQEVAAQLAIATAQTQLVQRVRAHAAELDGKVRERTAALEALAAELRRSEEWLRLLVGGVTDYAILTLDPQGRVATWNAGARLIKGYADDEIIGRHFSVFYPPEAREAGWPERVLQFAAERGHVEDEGWRVRKDGTQFWASVVVTAMRDAQGEIRGFSKITRDLSERKQAEEKVKALNKELESFSYSVSHDLRAPLRAVDGYARMLEEDYGPRLDDEGRRLLAVVRESSQRMGRLIDDLLAFSRLGRQEPAKQACDMTSLAQEVVHELRNGSTASIELGALPRVQADRALLRQVWANLVGNALKYSGKRADARIEIGGREENGEAIYWVRDNGAGFDMRYVGKLFGVFQRLHRADEFDGTGVGLAIVQRVVSRHGGRVWAEGKPGEGACFHFSLPRQA